MNNGKMECTFLWLIENYSYCSNQTEPLISPEFTADGLSGTVWYLALFNRADDMGSKGYISICLYRSCVDDGPENFALKFELSLLAADGSVLVSREFQETFEKGYGYEMVEMVLIEDGLLLKKADYLPQDTLTVRCKIWMGEGTIQQVEEITFRSRIGIEKISFLHVTESFSKLEPDQRKSVQIRSPSKTDILLTSNLFISDDSSCDGKIMVEIEPSRNTKVLSKCTFFVLDASGTAIKCGDADNRFDVIKKDIRKTPLSLTEQDILAMKSEYLPDDKLSLLIECVFSTGMEYGKIEKYLHEIPFVALNQIKDTDDDKDIYINKLSKCQSALDDLKEIYNDQVLTDVEIKTQTTSFHAHKTLLCARSPVFKSMLTNDMKEKHSNCIQIDDLEDDTMKDFLLFLYSDNIENLAWKSAIKLYYAGDKYAIEKLKIFSASFLARNVTIDTACELLLLAHTHNDSDLRKVVEDYILIHSEEVLDSEEWKNLEKSEPQLVIETMRLLLKKRK